MPSRSIDRMPATLSLPASGGFMGSETSMTSRFGESERCAYEPETASRFARFPGEEVVCVAAEGRKIRGVAVLAGIVVSSLARPLLRSGGL